MNSNKTPTIIDKYQDVIDVIVDDGTDQTFFIDKKNSKPIIENIPTDTSSHDIINNDADIINDDTDIINDNNFSDTIYLEVNDQKQILKRDAIKEYIDNILQQLDINYLDANKLTDRVYPKLKSVNTNNDIENQIVSSASEMVIYHHDYPKIAMWILMGNLHKNTHDDFLEVSHQLWKNKNKSNKHSPIINEQYYEFIKKHYKIINKTIKYDRDYNFSIFGFRTLEKSYLKKSNNKIVERPQHLYMRVAIALHYRSKNMNRILETYEFLSQGYFTHATPTLFNAGTTHEQLSSCFLLGIKDDMNDIGDCWKDCAMISKYAGGIGIHMSNIRVEGAYINSTQGEASGLRVLTIFNNISRYANQGGKRAGSFAVFIEPWHGDIFFFLDLKKNTGAETERARDLFLGLMINDIFMERVYKGEMWSLMCPSQCPEIIDKYGDEFTKAYIQCESEGRYVKQVPAQDLWFKIMEAQIETGVPYIAFKDAINKKSNQINIGVVNGLNLCCEIAEVSTADEYSVCNLSSICLPKFIEYENGKPSFNYNKLCEISRLITRNLNNIIDVNFYPVTKTKKSNVKNRPIGIGVQGLADVFAIFGTPFDSELARDLNRKIFETIYFGALTESMEIAKIDGPYETFERSPIQQGKFQFDLWGMSYDKLSGMWDWESLRDKIKIHGVRNSLVTTCMPTASTSQIMNYNECIEPHTENIYSRNTMAGEYFIINRYLIQDLIKLGLWDSDMVDLIKYYKGSIANIPSIPDHIKKIYRTVWEIPKKSIIEMAADRAPFIDQTQSMNLYIEKPDFAVLNSCLFYGWKLGLKTGIYYLRSKPASPANQFGIDITKIKEIEARSDIVKNPKINVQETDIVTQPKLCQFVPAHLREKGDCFSCDG
ncbi:ribonucleoside-diphosphate reductase large subunit [Cotonvirus japonicus]|uniref:Ribonucleoside-diphosphate reductase n=1 Tax=Cotonvirus japonicus TaxID=2811091 RepID=A0ABM7NSZ2_9VIRU|nr:ribonucleoside-diphosphate reductase large subunit [Cotonvirus japonicus]BCS83273.1 ribonucleoside-diphosphate reductase large subunit [Cotonvirus japonicus]